MPIKIVYKTTLVTALLLMTVPADAKDPIDLSEQMDFDRPESWAMKYFASVSLFTGMGTPDYVEAGAVDLFFEGGNVPALSEEERRVGFLGDKVEDLNRTDVFGRIGADIGLPSDLTLSLGWSPRVEVGGLKANLFSFALARPIYDESWRLGVRLHAESGSIDGDLVCRANVVGVDDPSINPLQCHAPSEDEQKINYVGLELSASKVLGDRWQPHIAVSANHMDLELRINSDWGRFLDRSVLSTSGWTYSATAGITYLGGERWRLAGEVLYAPLDVVRDPEKGSQNDSLLNARFRVSYRIH